MGNELRFGHRRAKHTVGDVRALEALFDPTRYTIMQRLDRPASIADVAAGMAAEANGLHYHFRILRTHGLIRTAGVRKRGRIRETLFVRMADRYESSGTAEHATAIVAAARSGSLETSFLRYARAMRARRRPGELRSHTDVEGSLTLNQARALQRRIDATVREFFEETAPKRGGARYGLLAVVSPLDDET